MPSFLARRCNRANCELSRLSTTAPPGSTPCENFRLGVGNRLDAGKEFQMHRLDRGDDGDMRPHHPDQRLDFAGVIHADLEDRKTRRRRAARQRQRHAPVIVERRGRGMGLALRAEHAPQRLLGRGLADRTGHRDHLRVQPRARGMREIDQTGEHVVDHQQRRIGARTFRAARLRPPPAPRRPSARRRRNHGRHERRP